MNIKSRLLLKAQATIAKQATPERKAQLDRLFSFDAGKPSISSFSLFVI
jgi:hypothetical protein